MRDKLIESLESMETCTKIVEIESKSWHDFWVVQRAVVRAMWLVLTWIIKQIDKKGDKDMLSALKEKEITEQGEVKHFYRDIDQVRLVYEETRMGHLELIGWYRP